MAISKSRVIRRNPTHQNFFLFPKKKRSMTTREIKSLQSSLLNTNPQGIRRIRTDDERVVNYEQYLIKRENRSRMAKNTRSQRAYQRGETNQANYKLKGYREVQRMLNSYLPALEDGGKFVIEINGTYYTLTLENYEDLTRMVNRKLELEDIILDSELQEYAAEGGANEYTESDGIVVDGMANGGSFSVGNPSARSGGGYYYRGGAFFPYTHNFECEDLTTTLHGLGVYKSVEKKNYDSNCLWLAFKSAGVDNKILQAMKFEFLRRTISRKNISRIAEQHNLYVEIRTDKDKDVLKYGNEDGFRVSIGCIQDHYFHFFDTCYNHYAILNYDEVKDKQNWYNIKSKSGDKFKREDRGMNTMNLLRAILQTNHVQKISIATHGIFRTQFYDKVSHTVFDTLEYPEKYSVPFHPKRDGGYELELKEPINETRLDELVLEIRSKEHGLLPDTRYKGKSTGKQKEHNKVRDVLDFLLKMKGNLKNGVNTVQYNYRHGVGRLYATGESKSTRSKSIAGCFSGLRAPLIAHKASDIDICNSLPTITPQWIRTYFPELLNDPQIVEALELLEDYVQNRPEWFAELMRYHGCHKDAAKTLMLTVLFGGDPQYHISEMPNNTATVLPRVQDLTDKLGYLRKCVVDTAEHEYHDLCELKRKQKEDEESYYRSVFAILTHEQENKCLLSMYNFFKEKEMEVYALIYDGLAVSHRANISSLLIEVQQRILTDTGYSLKLEEKPMYGLQNDTPKELECLQDIQSVACTDIATLRPIGFVNYREFVTQAFNGCEIVLENRSLNHLYGVMNYGDCPRLWNKSDGDPWDVVVPGYANRLEFGKLFKVTQVLGTLFLKNGNHKTFVRIDCDGFDEIRCKQDIESYKKGYTTEMKIKSWFVEDVKSYAYNEEEDLELGPEIDEQLIENTNHEKLKKKIDDLKESMAAKDPKTLKRLVKKIQRLKLGVVEQAKLLSRSRPVDARIFFDFEATTKMIHSNEDELISRCTEQILKTARHPEKIIAKIEDKVKKDKLDKESEAKLYAMECPHVAYQVCFSEYNEDTIHSYDGALCAKQMLDHLVEKYGCEISPYDGADSNDVPVIQLLAHNVTYDLSFLFQYLTRSNYIERGTSIVCGRARYIRFGHERDEGTRKNCPNQDLVNWMNTTGKDMYYNDPKRGAGRMENRGVWEKAVKILKSHDEYLTEYADFIKLKGIGKVIAEIVSQADFELFTPTKAFRLDKIVDIRFTDTNKIIPMALSEFGKSLTKDDQEKEIMPYELYTEDFVKHGGIATMEDLKNIPNFNDTNQLFRNLHKWNCIVKHNEETCFDMIKYSRIYCEADVSVLKKGFRVFQQTCLDNFDIDILHYPTISSLGDAYLTEQGCYIGVHKLAGVVQRFIALCSIGGRVMCANNIPVLCKSGELLKPWQNDDYQEEKRHKHVSSALADFDGVSLYPSAMERIPGFLTGAPKIWNERIGTNVESLNKNAHGYFLKIKVHTVGRKYRFPITRIKGENGNRWTNDLEDQEIYVDRFTLEDLERFSGITYTIIQGYYFDQERNDTINKVIRKLFNMRLKYKDEKNDACQLCIKLLMNSCYGVTGLKPIDVDIRYVNEGEAKDKFIDTHFNRIKSFTQMNNREWRFELYKEIDTHYNRQHVACEILSVSKNIMNEVMCLAEDVGGSIFYTDTDSMHIDSSYVEGENDSILGKAFYRKYGRELIGKNLGQFHTDFDFQSSYQNVNGKLVKCEKKQQGDIVATESIFLGKKSYIDRLEDRDGNKDIFHIRMKSIPAKCIQHKVSTAYGGDAMKMFRDLFDGKTVSFDMTAGGNVMFKVNKNHTMSSVSMIRKVRF